MKQVSLVAKFIHSSTVSIKSITVFEYHMSILVYQVFMNH